MVIRRIGPISCAKIAGVLYAVIGLVLGGIFSLAALGGAFPEGGGFPFIFGAGAIVVLPLFYGCLGFVFTLISAWLYNVLAGLVGGIELDLQ